MLELDYIAGARCGPTPAVIATKFKQSLKQPQCVANDLNLLWFLLRLSDRYSCLGRDDGEQQPVPGWSAFNVDLNSSVPCMYGKRCRLFACNPRLSY
jgi:hypothetical protein